MDSEAPRHAALLKRIAAALEQQPSDESGARLPSGPYQTLFTLNPEPMWVYEVGTLQILDVNEAATERYGYSRSEFLALTITDLRPEEDRPKFLELVASPPTLDRTGPWRHKLKDGTIIQVLITSHRVRLGDHDARVVMAESLTHNPAAGIE